MSRRDFSRTLTGIRKDKRKLAIVLLSILVVSGVATVFVISNVSEILKGTGNGSMNFGEANCYIDLTTTPLQPDGNMILIGVDGNQPIYLGSQEVGSIQIDVAITAIGSAVDWTTLNIRLEIYANDELLFSYALPEQVLDSSSLGYQTDLEESVEIDVENDWMGQPPSATGYDYYLVKFRVVANATINDANGNELADNTIVDNEWQFTIDPTGISAEANAQTAPILSASPPECVINQGENHILSWLVEDDNPATYIITTYTLADGSHEVDIGAWISDEPIQYDIGSYASVEPGTIYVSVGLKAIDEDGQQITDTVMITVLVPTTPDGPTFLPSSGNTEYMYPGVVEAWVTFKPRSAIPSSFSVYANGELIDSGSWSGADISVMVESVYTGTNKIKCVVIDTNGNVAYYIHYIFVSIDPIQIIDPNDPGNLVNAPLNDMQMAQISITVSGLFIILGAIVYWYSRRR